MLFKTVKTICLICAVIVLYFVTSHWTTLQRFWQIPKPCPKAFKEKLLKRKLDFKSKHVIRFNHDIYSKCLETNQNEDGIAKFMVDENFKNITCPDVKRFLKADEHLPKTAIASIPGSGNAWTRHLIEELTGIYTGTIYKQGPRSMLFNGDNTTERVIAIKTHETVQQAKKMAFDRVILIIRDPFDAHIAEFNRKYTNVKTGILSRDQFNFELFKELLPIRINEWLAFNEDWIRHFRGEIFVLFYERLQAEFYNSATKLAHFLRKRVSLEDLWCVSKKREGSYHRRSKPTWMSRSNFVDLDLHNTIVKGKEKLYDMCIKLRARITTNI